MKNPDESYALLKSLVNEKMSKLCKDEISDNDYGRSIYMSPILFDDVFVNEFQNILNQLNCKCNVGISIPDDEQSEKELFEYCEFACSHSNFTEAIKKVMKMMSVADSEICFLRIVVNDHNELDIAIVYFR